MGGGGGGPTQTTSTVQNTNIPAYAEPYVNTMLGATQKQLFNTTEVGGTPAVAATYDDQGNQLTAGTAAIPGYTSIEGFKPYQAYGGTYDAQGKQLSYDPSKAIAGFQDTQLAAQRGIAGMQSQSSLYDAAQQAAARAGLGADQSAAQAYKYGQLGYESGARGQELGQQAASDAMKRGDYAAQQAYTYGEAGARSGALGQQIGVAAAAEAQALAREQAARANKFGDAGFASGQKGQELGIAGGQLGITGGAKYGDIGAGYGAQAAGLADPALKYGGTGAGYGAQAAQLANTALGYGQGAADIGQMALRAQGMGSDVARQSQNIAGQQALAGQQYAQMATDPRVTQALMNPYTQNVLDVQNKELQRQSDIAGAQRGAQAARAGAFGGSRQAVENAEANRSLAVMKNANQAQALQQAYQQAQAQQQFGANLNLQGLAGAQQGLGTALQGGQLGLSGLGTALQGQQGALSGVGQAGAMYGLGMQGTQAGLQGVSAANQAYQSGIQGAGLGLQGVNTQLSGVDRQLAGTGQGMQGAQVGLAGVNAATAAGQLGLQGAQTGMQGTAQGMQGAQAGMQGTQTAINAGQYGLQGMQAGMQGTAQGMQGSQAGLQGVSGAQAGYGLLGQQGANLTNMLGQEQQNQLSLYGAQNQVGAQQQALEQAKINQSMLDYANAQQYPLMQLGTMSNMLRGLPMQASTTNQYAASPNPLSQAIGTIGAGTSIYNAYNPAPRGAAGGEVKGYAKGGIMSYDMGGEVESQLENMDEKGLQAQAKESSSPSIRRMAQRLLRERQMSKPQGTGPMGVQYQAAQPQMPSYAPGGIVAFQQGAGGNGAKSAIEEGGEENAKLGMAERLAMPPSTTPPPGGIMGATVQPVTQVPVAPQTNRALQQSPDIPAFMKAEYAEAERRKNAPLSEFMAERQAAMKEAGVADVSEGQQKMRAEMMAEKANLGEEKERQKHLRLAEFFASWGSTPGPVLVAGLNALQKTVPNIVADEREQKKARREIDKSIADLDNATRLEKRGEVDAAMALKLKAAEDMKALNIKFIDYQSRRESDASSFAATKYNADMQFRSEQLRANTARLDRAARRETEADSKAFGQYQTAANQEQRLISKIADQAKMFDKDYATIKTAEMSAAANDGKMNPALVPGYEAAKKKIADQEAIWTKQKEQAAADTDLAYKRVRINPEAAKDYTKPNAAPAAAPAVAPSGPISGEFSAPTAAHITALKKNPEQAEAFDAKFGPGAAKEYLGK
jgi:hypothetical protein